jgi:hypothetical protein
MCPSTFALPQTNKNEAGHLETGWFVVMNSSDFPQEEKWVLNTLLRVCMLWFVVPEQWPNMPFPSFLSQISRYRNIPTLGMNLASRSINTSSIDIRLDCSFWRYFGGYESMKYVLRQSDYTSFTMIMQKSGQMRSALVAESLSQREIIGELSNVSVYVR